MKIIDLTGQKFGRLTVIKQNGILSSGKSGRLKAWLCQCDCGNTKTIRGCDLRSGDVSSCGCYKRELSLARLITHGKYGTHLYQIWRDMKKRGSGKGGVHNKRFYKGISICKEWEIFENFYEWAKNKWSEGLVIDRINTLAGYSPDNCRFVTTKENNQNTKRSKIWIIYGKTFKSSQDAANAFGCSQSHIYFMCHGRHHNKKYYPPDPNCEAIKKYQGAS